MSDTLEIRRLGKLLSGLSAQVTALSRENRFSNASLEDAGFNSYDLDGNLVARAGKQFDGTNTFTSLGGPKPPRPSSPSYRVDLDEVFITWNGTFAAGTFEIAPQDWARAEVHVGGGMGDPLLATSLRDTIETARGGTKLIRGLPKDTDLYAWIVVRSQSGKFSDPSSMVGPFRVVERPDPAAALAAAEAATELAQGAADTAASAEAAALEAAGIAALAGRIVFTVEAPPASTTTLWVRPPDNVPHRYDDDLDQWVPVPDAALAAAVAEAAQAKSAADTAAQAAADAAALASTAQGAAAQAVLDAQAAYELAETAEATGSTAAGAAATAQQAADDAAGAAAAALGAAQAAGGDATAAQGAADAAAAAAATAQEAADAAGTAAAQADADAAQAAADAAQALADAAAAASAASAAQGTADTAAGAASTAATKAQDALDDAAEALGVANGKGKIVFTTSKPAGDPQTLWVPPPNNIPHRWNGTDYVPIPDAAIKAATDKAIAAETAAGNAATAAQDAQNAASTATGKAETALTTAQGKNTVTYSEAVPSNTANPGIRANDLWYQLAPGTFLVIGTWRWSGTAWVGTTFGDAVLTSITVGKLTSGTMNAAVVMAGRFTTALTGARREMNAVGFQAWDASNSMTINLDGVNNLLTGRYRTAISGRRIEMASGGSLSQIDFWGTGASTNRTFIRAFTESDGKEAIQIGHGDPTTRGLDERININTAGWFTSRFRRTDFVVGENWNLYGAAVDAGQQFMGYTSASKQLVWRNIQDEFSYHTYKYWYGLGSMLHEQNDGFTWRVRPAAGADVDFSFSKAGRLRVDYGADAYYGGWFELMEAAQAYTTSPRLGLFTNNGDGGYMRLNAGPGYQDMEFKWWDNSFYINLVARAFVVASDAAGKQDIATTDTECLAEVTNTRVAKYKRIDDKNEHVTGREEIGLIAQEAPAQIVHDTGAEGELAIDVYQGLAMLWGAVQELAVRVDALDGKNSKEKKVKPPKDPKPKTPKGKK